MGNPNVHHSTSLDIVIGPGNDNQAEETMQAQHTENQDNQTSDSITMDVEIDDIQPSLWREIWEKVSQDDKALFPSIEDDFKVLHDHPEKLLDILQGAKTVCLDENLHHKRNEQRVNLRDITDKLITWVQKFVAVGDTLVQFNPTVAAIPWALVRFILQVCSLIHKFDRRSNIF